MTKKDSMSAMGRELPTATGSNRPKVGHCHWLSWIGLCRQGNDFTGKSMAPAFKTLLVGTATVLFAACDSGGGKFARTFASPDQAYVAVLISEVGGGFPGASCVDTVVIVPGKALSSGNYPPSSRAYVGGCHSLKMTSIDGKWVVPNGPQLRWTAPRELSIVFDPKLARNGGSAFYSVTSLYEGAVKIRNEPQ